MPMLGAGGGSAAMDNVLSQLDAAAAGGGAAQTAVSPYRIPVRTGRQYSIPSNRGQFDGDINTVGKTVRQPRDQSERFDLTDTGVQAAIGMWYGFDDDYRSSMMKRMWFLGLIKTPTDFDAATKVWQQAVGHAANFANQGREIDPQDVLEMMADGSQGANGGPGSSGYRQQATTHRSIDLTDPATAREWVQQAFKQSMGRKAEDAEVRAMVDALHKQQQSNPQVTTMTPTKWDANGNAIESTTTTTGGVDPNSFFAQQMAADPEAGAHQAAAELFPALMQAIGSAV